VGGRHHHRCLRLRLRLFSSILSLTAIIIISVGALPCIVAVLIFMHFCTAIATTIFALCRRSGLMTLASTRNNITNLGIKEVITARIEHCWIESPQSPESKSYHFVQCHIPAQRPSHTTTISAVVDMQWEEHGQQLTQCLDQVQSKEAQYGFISEHLEGTLCGANVGVVDIVLSSPFSFDITTTTTTAVNATNDAFHHHPMHFQGHLTHILAPPLLSSSVC
jgi:hypothetical protein